MGSAPFSLQRIINDHSAKPFLISLFLFKWWGLHISGKTRSFFYITSSTQPADVHEGIPLLSKI
jgi:hypothetical protein